MEPLWTFDVDDHHWLQGVDRAAAAEWTRWARLHHPLVWAVCDWGEAWVLRCWAYYDKNGKPAALVECEAHGRSDTWVGRCRCEKELVTEDVLVGPPPAGLVERTRRALSGRPGSSPEAR